MICLLSHVLAIAVGQQLFDMYIHSQYYIHNSIGFPLGWTFKFLRFYNAQLAQEKKPLIIYSVSSQMKALFTNSKTNKLHTVYHQKFSFFIHCHVHHHKLLLNPTSFLG